MKNLYDDKNSTSLALSNCFSLTITIDDRGENVNYQYSNSNKIKTAEIEYTEDTENKTGYADTEDGLFQASFKTDQGIIYFIGEFMRNNF